MSINREMDKANVVFIHDAIFSSIKENKIVSFVGKWIEWELIILNNLGQS